MNRTGSVSPVGHRFRCGLFVRFHCVPEMRGSTSERFFFPGIIKHLFFLPQLLIQSMRLMSVGG